MTDRKRVLALLLCVGLAAVLCVSTLHIALEADHDCCGEDCPICEMIAVNVRLLRAGDRVRLGRRARLAGGLPGERQRDHGDRAPGAL